ncbi:MAG: DUF937 domain-containing protein, partial [Pseudomonadota bacterium]|nr:DUF937 domain-containing protein [Pseudomonadota bacterium]
PDNIGAIAGMLGEDNKKTASGLAGAMPALLGGLLGSFDKPQGQDAFSAAVDKADPGLLGNLAGALGGSGGSSMVSTGLKMATSLFGDNKMGLLGTALSAFSGLSSGSSKSLLGMAVPLLLGMLSKQKKSDGLDAGGLIEMLMGQKDNVAKAMPADFSKALSGSGILDSLTGAASAGAGAAASAARSAAAGTQQAAQKSKSMFSRLLPLIIIAAVAWFAMQYLFKPKPVEQAVAPVEQVQAPVKQVQETTSAAQQVGEAAMQALMVDNINLGQELTAMFDSAGKTLTGITDVASAQNAVEDLGKVNQALDVVSSLAAKLPPEGRQMLAGIIGELAPSLDKAIAAAYAIPGVGDALGDTVTALLQKLSALAKV